MRKILIAALSLAVLSGCSSSKLAKNEKRTVEVAIDLNNVVDDKVQVTVNPQKIKEASVVYQIPAIVPGTYVISDYGKFVVDFKAYDYDGNEMVVQKLDPNSWQVNNAQQLDKVSYWVEDTFDSEKKHKIYVMAGTNIEKDQNFFLNLPGFVGYFKGKKESPYEITISHPEKLYETSSLINQNTTKEDNTKDVFVASRYDEISDNPIMYAPLNYVSFNMNGVDVTLAVYSPNNVHAAKDMEEDLKKMIEAQTNFLEGFETTNEYNILLYLFDPKVYKWNSFGALEHLSSTTVVYPESYTKQQLKNGMINGTVSHEFFHIVSPLSVHSEEIHSFDFNKPNMSKHLWMYEGTTEYFANLFQVNQGLIDEQAFINTMQGKITTSKRFDDAMSFTEMSKNILEDKYAKNYSNVYMKGALIGMTLDILLREESKGAYGIRDLMRDLSKKYGAKKPFKDDEIIAEIVAMTYPSIGEFFKKHVEGNTPINYNDFFAKVGVKEHTETVDVSYFLDKKNQPFVSVNNNREIFFTKRTNSGLVALGIKAGDILKSVNGEAVSLQNARQIVGKSFQWKEGDDLKMEVLRDGKTVTLESKIIKPQAESTSLKIEELPADNPKVKLRNAWLKG
ncbi:lipoprotein [Flavobacteriaceae bacterium S356]|uniref:Type IV secretion system putative lipoprotein virB7 n=1 Tax=Asprobacillus argus TaxID=3076534 RepID=A0ABU3LEU8_9FLAO|nr:lipoprotein [Flavobacteriaceae bacterium S356]